MKGFFLQKVTVKDEISGTNEWQEYGNVGGVSENFQWPDESDRELSRIAEIFLWNFQ